MAAESRSRIPNNQPHSDIFDGLAPHTTQAEQLMEKQRSNEMVEYMKTIQGWNMRESEKINLPH